MIKRNIYKKLKQLFYQDKLVFMLIYPLKVIWDIIRFRLLPDSLFLSLLYKRIHGKLPDLKNPSGLNEKILWLKLHEKGDLMTDCADKYKVREYIKKVAGEKYLIPLVMETRYPEKITPENLPEYPVIVKTNHNSGGNQIIYDKRSADYGQLHSQLKELLKRNFYYITKEYQYKNIERRIIVEKLLTDESNSLPMDYKFHCFNGTVQFIQLDIDRFTNHKRNFYDSQWNLLPFTWCPLEKGRPIWGNADKDFKAPEKLDEMINLAQKLATPFKYARIDLYYFKEQVYFGEITFHHGSGNEVFLPSIFDNTYGQLLKLNP